MNVRWIHWNESRRNVHDKKNIRREMTSTNNPTSDTINLKIYLFSIDSNSFSLIDPKWANSNIPNRWLTKGDDRKSMDSSRMDFHRRTFQTSNHFLLSHRSIDHLYRSSSHRTINFQRLIYFARSLKKFSSVFFSSVTMDPFAIWSSIFSRQQFVADDSTWSRNDRVVYCFLLFLLFFPHRRKSARKLTHSLTDEDDDRCVEKWMIVWRANEEWWSDSNWLSEHVSCFVQ